jgi:formate hydrogenlyase subunit 3/multisubunit Na+/H+ antiporter MnhD subunit
MSLLPFLTIAFGAGALSLLIARVRRASAVVGLVGLILATILAASIRDDAPFAIAGGAIAGSAYVRLFLVLGCAGGVLVAIVALATSWPRSLPGATLLSLGAAGFALGVTDPGTAVAAATGGGVVGILITLVGRGTERGLMVAIRELRALVVAGVLALLAAAAITGPVAASRIDPAIAALSYFGFAAAVAVRFGAIPFHVWAARVADAAPEVGLPLVTAWSPAAFAVVALSWTQAAVPAFVQPLVAERAIIVAIAVLSIVLATAAACVNGDIEHVVGYSMVADGGIALLGLAVLDPQAWAATRTWLLAVVITKTAFAAWAAALHATFGTRKLADLHGWAIRAPVLGLALLGILVAGVGWPGMAVFAARATLIDLAVQAPFGALLLGAALAAVLYYARLLLIGVAPPGDIVLTAPERPTRRQPEPLPRLPRARRKRGLRRFSRPEMGALWQARRLAIAGATVLVLAALSIGVAGGSFGVRAAAEAPPPAASAEPGAGAVPSAPSASDEPLPASPQPSLEPAPSG